MSLPIDKDDLGIVFSASIGEPWDFHSDAGAGRVEGRLIAFLTDENGKKLLAMQILPFIRGGKEIFRLLGSQRYESDLSLEDQIKQQFVITLNMYYRIDGSDIIAEFANKKSIALMGEEVGQLVGSIREYHGR